MKLIWNIEERNNPNWLQKRGDFMQQTLQLGRDPSTNVCARAEVSLIPGRIISRVV